MRFNQGIWQNLIWVGRKGSHDGYRSIKAHQAQGQGPVRIAPSSSSHNTPRSWRLRLTCLWRGPALAFARHLESGYEKTRLYLKEVREDKDKTEGLPSAVDLKSSNKLRANVKNPRRKVWPSLVHRHTHELKEDLDERSVSVSESHSSSFLLLS